MAHITEFGGGDLTYKSERIYERRHRTLREVRLMIVEDGLENFSVRELCRRAGIAQGTFYNAFGSRENAIALAIRQYLWDFEKNLPSSAPPLTIAAHVERTVRIQTRNLQIQPYSKAIISVYYSSTAERAIRDAIRNVAAESYVSFFEHLQQTGDLRPEVAVADAARLVARTGYSVLMEWCFGEIADGELVPGVVEAMLIAMGATTRGATHDEVEQWLTDVRSRGPMWTALLHEVTRSGVAGATSSSRRVKPLEAVD